MIGLITFFKVENLSTWIVMLMSVGLVTDIFDGIIARKLNVSTEKLRVMDSNVDQIFWLIVIGSIFYINIYFVIENIIWLSLIIFLELLCYISSYKKFRRSIATHAIASKIWTLSLLVFLVDLTLNSTSDSIFVVCLVLGILSRIEIFLIILRLNEWTADVPSILVVSKINQGIPVKKSKLFNG